jgi:Cdc6-like AAA superfamily ATPase
VCDLTKLSPNVLFELGYAIARDKHIWITLNPTYPEAKSNYRKLGLLWNIGYAPYENSFMLAGDFLEKGPFKKQGDTLLKAMFPSMKQAQREKSPILYLMSEVRSDSSVELTRLLQKSDLPLVTDDPQEVASQPLSWYAQNAFGAHAVVAHLLDEKRASTSSYLRNAQYSLVGGMAYGFAKHLLMLAHYPFNPPVDFSSLLHVHRTARECRDVAEAWIPVIEEDYAQTREKYRRQRRERRTAAGLLQISLGEVWAENERDQLSDYFVVTASYTEALNTSQYLICVGRKGSGKTANLYEVSKELRQDKRNHVCIIKPIDYELDGVVRLLTSSLAQADPGYLTQSLWKFLVYTELAQSVRDELQSMPAYYRYTDAESEFLEYVDENRGPILTDFTVRMEYAIRELCDIGNSASVGDQRARVSEVLHDKLLSDLRVLLGKVLNEKHKVFVLIDNLDKAWSEEHDLGALSDFLFGLLSAGQTISADFQKDRERWPGVNLSLVIFLRSDIFSYVRTAAREGDKTAYTRMHWDDPVLLQRVIEERFINSLGESVPREDIWRRFFVAKVDGKPTKEYIVGKVMPQPRDMIFFCKSALNNAINHNHTRIEVSDILQAEEAYSIHAFESLMVEIETQLEGIQLVIYDFAGRNEIITRDDVLASMRKEGVPLHQIDTVIELLCDYNFLGLEVEKGEFRFLYQANKKEVFRRMAERTAEQTGTERYRIMSHVVV